MDCNEQLCMYLTRVLHRDLTSIKPRHYLYYTMAIVASFFHFYAKYGCSVPNRLDLFEIKNVSNQFRIHSFKIKHISRSSFTIIWSNRLLPGMKSVLWDDEVRLPIIIFQLVLTELATGGRTLLWGNTVASWMVLYFWHFSVNVPYPIFPYSIGSAI